MGSAYRAALGRVQCESEAGLGGGADPLLSRASMSRCGHCPGTRLDWADLTQPASQRPWLTMPLHAGSSSEYLTQILPITTEVTPLGSALRQGPVWSLCGDTCPCDLPVPAWACLRLSLRRPLLTPISRLTPGLTAGVDRRVAAGNAGLSACSPHQPAGLPVVRTTG